MRVLTLNYFQAILFLTVVSLLGCGYGKALQSAAPKGFIERHPEGAEGVVSGKYPFQYVWTDVNREQSETDKVEKEVIVFVAPVGLNFLGELEWKDRWLQDSVRGVAVYLHDQIIEEIKNSKEGPRKVVVADNRESAEYALEIEIVEVGFGDPALYVATFIIPVPGVATAVDAAHTAVMAVEARLVEVQSEKIVSTMADRKIPKVRLLDLNKAISKTAPLRDISNDWAIEISRSLAVRGVDSEKVEGTMAFTLIPW